MPDKSKKRKNNKNKRKNKGHQQNNNTNARITTEVNEQGSDQIEQSDSVSKEKEETTELQQEVEGDININFTESQIPLESKSETKEPSKNNASTNYDEPIQLKSGIKILNKENTPSSVSYRVESPEKTIKSKQKLKSDIKSKSVDSDDQPIIVEIVGDLDKQETSNVNVDTGHVLITEFEPDIEWEKTDEIKNFSYVVEEIPVPGVLSVTTIPLNLAECEVIKSMSPEDEKSLRQYLNTLSLSTNTIDSTSLEIKSEIEKLVNQDIKQRLRKKGFGEESFSSRPGPARSLHVIDEEASGESSSNSRRHSYLNDRKSDEELEDDVFHPTNDIKEEIKFRKGRKSNNLISQECFRVDAQIKNPEISEARGSWTTTTVEKMTGAEIVYLTDSSSSTSSLYDNNDIEENNEDSDVSIRIITPTIEVIDTDSFLKNDFNCNFVKSQLDDKIISNNLQEENQMQNQHLDDVNSENKHPESENKNISEEIHEIVVLSTDTINTNLIVKDIEKPNLEDQIPFTESKKVVDNYDLEIKVLKCELNDAINNLIKEVVSDSDTTQDCYNDSLERQDSSSSVGSSQCTAKYNPKCSSLNDVSSTEFDDIDKGTVHPQTEDSKSHVKDVIKKIEDINVQNHTLKIMQTLSLRDICLEKICKLPYGKQILEELANVSERLQTLSDHAVPIGFSRITTSKDINFTSMKQNISELNALSNNKIVMPPPIKPRNSSLKINHDEAVKINSIKSEPKRYICLSPSQKMLMEQTNSVTQDKNSETVKEREKADNKNEASISNNKKTFDISFKSQTGSRLLALLRNQSFIPSSPEQKFNDEKDTKLFDPHTGQDLIFTNTVPEYPVQQSNVQDVYKKGNTFKPIPPPKPRKYSSSFYESDESSDFVDKSFKSVKNYKKHFHFSTGNLNQEIVDDISSIQNMHRHYNDIYRQAREDMYPRRPSLPKDLCDQQMEYIRQKEKEVEAEIYRLENERIKTPQRKGPRAPMLNEEFEEDSFKSFNRIKNSQSYGVLPSHIAPSAGKLTSAFSKSQEELLRDKMYSEYVTQMSEREERKQKKVIKITKTPLSLSNTCSKSSSELNIFDCKVNNRIEKEFIDKAKERWNKLGIRDPETEDECDKNFYKQPKVIEHKIKVIDSGEEKDVQKLPNHLQDFVKFRAKDKSYTPDSPGESESRETSSHGVILCAVFILMFTITKYIIRLVCRRL